MKIILKHGATGQHFELSTQKAEVLVGRSNKCDLVINDEALSRVHAIIENTEAGLFITDNDSTNGVYIDNIRIPPNQRTPITTFIQVAISQLICEISIAEEEPEVPHDSGLNKSFNQDSGSSRGGKPTVRPPPPQLNLQEIKTSKSRFMMVAALIGVALIAGTYLSLLKKEPEKTATVIGPAKPKPPEKFDNIPDRSLTAAEYIALGNPNCKDAQEWCKEMKLDPSKGEGVIKMNNEIFIYMIPEFKYANVEFEKIRNLKDKDDIIGLHGLLNSSAFREFENDTFGQIHLIFMKDMGGPTRVIRLHTQFFSEKRSERGVVFIRSVNRALDRGNSEELQIFIKNFVKVVNF